MLEAAHCVHASGSDRWEEARRAALHLSFDFDSSIMVSKLTANSTVLDASVNQRACRYAEVFPSFLVPRRAGDRS